MKSWVGLFLFFSVFVFGVDVRAARMENPVRSVDFDSVPASGSLILAMNSESGIGAGSIGVNVANAGIGAGSIGGDVTGGGDVISGKKKSSKGGGGGGSSDGKKVDIGAGSIGGGRSENVKSDGERVVGTGKGSVGRQKKEIMLVEASIGKIGKSRNASGGGGGSSSDINGGKRTEIDNGGGSGIGFRLADGSKGKIGNRKNPNAYELEGIGVKRNYRVLLTAESCGAIIKSDQCRKSGSKGSTDRLGITLV